jgi:tripartite-type tricarboxylate transporter receptor subunit TctC
MTSPARPIMISRILASLLAAVVFLSSAPAFAQPAFPSRPITLIVPFPPGGSTDVIARVIAEGLRGVLGQPVIVENRGGAGGSTGTTAIAKAAPDGYTIGMGTGSTLAINPAVYRSLPYDVLADLAPVSNMAAVPNIMSVHPALKANDMAELIALARAQPGKLAYASAGNGTVAHLLGEQFKLATGTDLLHVPYRGVGLVPPI